LDHGAFARISFIAVLALLFAGCGKPFDVKPVARVSPETIGPASAAGPLDVRSAPVWDEDWLLETLDANAVLAGVLPVRVHVENTSAEPVSARKAKFELAGPGGARFKHLSPKRAMKAIEGYYEVTMSSKSGRERYREDFLANALDLDAPLAPGESRQGFLFFAIPKGVNGRVPTTLDVRLK
jgi:hypothetical protein